MSKVDRAAHGPSWGEVILGAVLSLLLGIVLGAALLILKPVVAAKEVPKDPQPGAVYYVEGLRGDSTRAKQALAKRKALMEGQSVKVTEDEVNSLVSAAAAPTTAAAKPGEPAPAAKPAQTISTGTPNVRIREGVMQIGVPVTLNVFGFEQKVIAQTRGGFEKQGDRFVYEPTEMYLGSCPVQRLPFLAGYLKEKALSSEQVPADISAAWSRLTTVAIEGNALVLAAQ